MGREDAAAFRTALDEGAAVSDGAVGGAVSMLAGVGTALVGALAAYMATLSLQSKVDEKDIFKMVARRSYPTLYLVRPKHIRNIWKGFNLAAGKAAED